MFKEVVLHTKFPSMVVALLVMCSLVTACTQQETAAAPSDQAQAATGALQGNPTVASASSAGQVAPPLTITLDPSKGSEIGSVFEAFLSPHQEPGEEKDTPSTTPKEFLSTTPSLLRSERTSRGHGVVRFTKDLSKAYVDVKVEGVKLDEVNMFHIHCGRPDMLGPIIIDFAFAGDVRESLSDGMLSVVLTDADVEKEAASGHGLVGAFTAGCPIVPGLSDRAKTIAGMEYIAQQGELYFNLHTTSQTYFGDIRGQLHAVKN